MVNFYSNPVLCMPFSRSLRSRGKGERGMVFAFWAAKPPKMQKPSSSGIFTAWCAQPNFSALLITRYIAIRW